MHDAPKDGQPQPLPKEVGAASIGAGAQPDQHTDASGIGATGRAMARGSPSLRMGQPLQLGRVFGVVFAPVRDALGVALHVPCINAVLLLPALRHCNVPCTR